MWICSDPWGHLQVTGIDAAGRKQYLYHPRWRERRDRQKFETMLEFAQALPKLRRKVRRDLAGDGLDRERVMACTARLLDVGFFRIRIESYAEENESYGLATLLKSQPRFPTTRSSSTSRPRAGSDGCRRSSIPPCGMCSAR